MSTPHPRDNAGNSSEVPGGAGYVEVTSADDDTRASDGPASARSTDSLVADPYIIEGYKIENEIHRGGQGVVYRAVQLSTKRVIALKVLLEGPFAGESTRRRFEREIELAAGLRHTNIVTILDSGVSLGRYYFAMEYIDGQRLDRYLAQTRPPLEVILLLLEKVCAAVNFAHQRGVIHRDLKPPNILVDAEGEPHILDFGLAKNTLRAGAEDPTVQMISTSGQLLGTIAYMSPEQTRNAQDADVRSDVYALGVVFYEALVGQLPYSVDGPLAEVLHRIAEQEPARPRSLTRTSRFGRRIDDELETILLKALEKDPMRRYQTSGDLGRDLRHLRLGEPIEAKRASNIYMLRKMLRRYRVQATAVLVLFLAFMAFGITSAVFYAKENKARQDADKARTAATNSADEARKAKEEALEQKTEVEKAYARLKDSTMALERALLEQKIQAGELASERGDLLEARESYWRAYIDDIERAFREHRTPLRPSELVAWALRQYYASTPDNGAAMLELQVRGNAVLSPDGTRAVVQDAADTIAVRDVINGVTLQWFHLPGAAIVMNVSDDGVVAAAGDGWVRVWQPDSRDSRATSRMAVSLAPQLAFELPPAFKPFAVYPRRDLRGVIVLGESRVLSFWGGATASYTLRSAPTGRPDFSYATDKLAVPTTAGVFLITIREDESLHGELVWQAPGADQGVEMRDPSPVKTPTARAVRFSEDLLAVLADRVYVRTFDDMERNPWVEAIPNVIPEKFGIFDLRNRIDAIALATTDGEVQVYRGGKLEWGRKLTRGGLRALRVTPDRAIATLDDRGSYSRWIPPIRKERPQVLNERAAASWDIAPDRSTVLLAEDDGRISVYDHRTESVLKSYAAPYVRPERVELATSNRVGDVVHTVTLSVSITSSSMRFAEFEIGGKDRSNQSKWAPKDSRDVEMKMSDIAMSSDGTVVAWYAISSRRDEQQIGFWEWSVRDQNDTGDPPPAIGSPVPLPGATVRAMGFVPGTHRLLVARSNGELLSYEPSLSGGAAQRFGGAQRGELVRTLESPAQMFAFEGGGDAIAILCDDNRIRVIDLSAEALERPKRTIYVDAPVASMSFGENPNLLLVRTQNGGTTLFEIESGTRTVLFEPTGGTTRALVGWFGDAAGVDGDASILMNTSAGVKLHRFRRADQLIASGVAYAIEQQAARLVEENDFPRAWELTDLLAAISDSQSSPRIADLRLRLLDAALRSAAHRDVAAWLGAVRPSATAEQLVRLGDAAYAGDRFELALDLLSAGISDIGGLDSASLLRYGQVLYVNREFKRSADVLAEALARPDFTSRDAPLVSLQKLGALIMSDQKDVAEREFAGWGKNSGEGWSFAIPTAEALLSRKPESGIVGTITSLVKSVTSSEALAYRNDSYFYLGELAQKRGDTIAALNYYQQCVDNSSDKWPANWSLFRILQRRGSAR